jgi:hypothetical protein
VKKFPRLMDGNPSLFDDIEIEGQGSTSFTPLVDYLTDRFVYFLVALLLLFALTFSAIAFRAPELTTSLSNYYKYDNRFPELGLTFGFAVKRSNLAGPRLILRAKIIRKHLRHSFRTISFNRTSHFLKNSTVFFAETRQFSNVSLHFDAGESQSDYIDLLDESISSSCDSLSFLFAFPSNLNNFDGLVFVSLFINRESAQILAKMNRILAGITVYSFICYFLIGVPSFHFEIQLPTSICFALVYFGFGESTMSRVAFASFVFLLKLRLWSLIRNSSRFVDCTAVVFLHEFLEFGHLDRATRFGHFTYFLIVVCRIAIASDERPWPTPVLLYISLCGVSGVTGLMTFCVCPELNWMTNSIVPDVAYRTVHWMIGLMIAFCELPFYLKGGSAPVPFRMLDPDQT